MMMEEPSGWVYWTTIVFTAIGGGATVRYIAGWAVQKILKEVREIKENFNLIPSLQQSIQTLELAVKELQAADLKNSLGKHTDEIGKLDARIAELEGAMYAYFGAVNDGVFVCDRDGKTIWVNHEVQGLTGLSREELMGDGWKGSIHPEDADKVIQKWVGFASGIGRRFKMEYRFLHADGKVVKVSCNAHRDKLGGRGYTRIVGVLVRSDSQ